MCSCVSPGRSGPTAVPPTRVGSLASPGTAAPSNTQSTREPQSSQGTGRWRTSLSCHWCLRPSHSLRRKKTPGGHRRGRSGARGQRVPRAPGQRTGSEQEGLAARRPRRRGRRVVAAPAAFSISQEAHPERLGPNADADGLRVGCGEPAHAPGGRSVRGRLEVKALPLGRCLPGCMEGHSRSTSRCTGWRREIQEGPQICCGSAVLGGLDGAESRFLCGVHTCQAGGLCTSLAWSLDAALGGRGRIPADERHCGEAGFHFIFPGG